MSNSEIKPVTLTNEDEDVVEIRLDDVLSFFKGSRRTLLVSSLIGTVVGIFYAFSRPSQYTSQVTVLPEIQTKSPSNLGNLSSLAGLAGIDIDGVMGGSDVVRPELYPNVLQSAPFALALFKKPVREKNSKRIQSLEAYLNEKTSSWLPTLAPFNSDEKDEQVNTDGTSRVLWLNKQQESLASLIHSQVTGVYDKKTGVLSISTVMPDPVVSADVVNYSLSYLTDYITTYRTEKARQEVSFLSKQVSLARRRYQLSEYALADYRDRNRSTYLNTTKIDEQRIQAEFILAQDIYNSLSKQLETSKIKVQQETPVFKVLEPARISLRKSGPNRLVIIAVVSIAGLIVGILYSYINRK